MDDPPRCRVCGDPIGMYEPLVVLAEGETRETSRLEEPGGRPAGDLYHRSCFLEAGAQGPLDS
ncbi:MAG: hypothetical protein ACLQBB_08360 [Solirubrobacteraceae bacterium]